MRTVTYSVSRGPGSSTLLGDNLQFVCQESTTWFILHLTEPTACVNWILHNLFANIVQILHMSTSVLVWKEKEGKHLLQESISTSST